jgi:hypothetical protein
MLKLTKNINMNRIDIQDEKNIKKGKEIYKIIKLIMSSINEEHLQVCLDLINKKTEQGSLSIEEAGILRSLIVYKNVEKYDKEKEEMICEIMKDVYLKENEIKTFEANNKLLPFL